MSVPRRSFLHSLLGGLGLGVAARSAAAEPAASPAGTGPSPFRVAFLTDTHLPQGKPEVATSTAALIRSIQSRPAAPDLFLFGGDNVMAVDGDQSDEQADEQFRLWRETVMDSLRTPVLSVIGNHDIRWKDRDSAQPEAYREKARAVSTYRMPARHYRADHGGWSFFLLDTFQYSGCELDEAQWTWFEKELAAGTGPACVVTHAPLFSATHFLEPEIAKGYAYHVPAGWSPRGLSRFRKLFQEHPRVKLCLSGHMHTCDRVDVDNVTYVCGGAVSGNWWKGGDYRGFRPLWIELTLSPDGTWTHQRHEWT